MRRKGIRKIGLAVFAAGMLAAILFTDVSTKAAYAAKNTSGMAAEDVTEYTGSIEDLGTDGFVEHTDDGVQARGTTFRINHWAVTHNTTHATSSFTLNAGQTVQVAASLSPNNKTLRVGLIRNGQKITYILGRGTVSHTFMVNQPGSYQLFISNSSIVTVYADGYYIR